MAPCNQTTRRGKQAGFTLIEALAAMVILAFGIMAIANLMLIAGTSNRVADQSTAATLAAVQQLEALKVSPWNTAPTAARPGIPLPAAGATLGDLDNDVAGYSFQTVVPAPGQVAQIPVRVRWTVTGLDVNSVFITVRAEAVGPLAGARTRAEFTTVRTCSTC